MINLRLYHVPEAAHSYCGKMRLLKESDACLGRVIVVVGHSYTWPNIGLLISALGWAGLGFEPCSLFMCGEGNSYLSFRFSRLASWTLNCLDILLLPLKAP